MKSIGKMLNAKETAPVKVILNELLRSQEKGDIEAFKKCFAHDENMVNIGTDLDEVWLGWNPFYNWMKSAISNRKEYNITEKDTRIQLSHNQDVAWYSQLLDTCFETKGEPHRLEGFRHTGVLEKRDGKWMIVQSHVSLPDNTIDHIPE